MTIDLSRGLTALASTGPAGAGTKPGASAEGRAALLVGLAVGIGYYLGAQLGIAFGSPAVQMSIIWPPNAILIVALLLTPRRRWWVVMAAALVAKAMIVGPSGVPLHIAAWYVAANLGQSLLAVLLLQRLHAGVPRFDSFWSTARFIAIAAILAPATVSLLLTALVTRDGWATEFWLFWQSRFLTEALSTLAIVPPLLYLLTTGRRTCRAIPARRYGEAALLAAGFITLGIVSHANLLPPLQSLPALLYAPLALFLWAGVRFGVVGLSVSLLLVAALSLWDASHGIGPFAGRPPADTVLELQLFLIEIGLPVMLMAALFDERRGIVRNLRASNEESRYLARKLISAQERERTLIARELHDEIGQALTVVKLNLDTMRLLPDTTERGPLLDEGVLLIEQAIEQVRDLSLLLRPAMLDHLGLEAALRWLVTSQAQRGGYQATFRAARLPAAPPGDIEITCYRVLQEALTNIARHSRARHVTVDLQVVDGQLRLVIVDDGDGFDLAGRREQARQGNSMGLLSLEERASLVQGRLSLTSMPGRGTTVILTVPWSPTVAS